MPVAISSSVILHSDETLSNDASDRSASIITSASGYISPNLKVVACDVKRSVEAETETDFSWIFYLQNFILKGESSLEIIFV